MKMRDFFKSGFFAWLLLTVIVIAIVAFIILLVMILWNAILFKIFFCDKINFWQSAGIIVLFSLLTFDKAKLFNWLYE
jgi:hypothetical protein